ncbi:MAG: YhgN family NAAT transporter [Thermodesulfobacteriota bacterium]
MDFVSAAVMLFLIMDPIGNMPVFHGIMGKIEDSRRTRVMIRELVIAYLVLCVFLFGGRSFLSLLGVEQSTLGIAGGIILFLVALRMVFPQHGLQSAEESDDPFIVPLAVPLIAGPSAMAMLLLLVSNYPDRLWAWLGALTLAWIGTAAILLPSNFFIRFLGDRGIRAMTKLMGMLLIMIAMQMLLDGIHDYFSAP